MTPLPLRERMRNEPVFGTWLQSNSVEIAELLASIGFDFVTIDAEHAGIGIADVQALCQAINAGDPDCAPLVRLPSTEYEVIKRHLDVGAEGVIAPLVKTKEDVERVVRAARYPPDGDRGVGFARSNLYGTEFDESVPADNESTLVCLQIEHDEAVENIDAMCNVSGVDAAMFGPYDLSASLGVPSKFDHPEFLDAVKTVENACEETDVTLGTHVVEPDTQVVQAKVKAGYQFIAYSLDVTILSTAFQHDLQTIQANCDR